MYGSVSCRDAETTAPATCSAASSELHRATSAKLHVEMASNNYSTNFMLHKIVHVKELRGLYYCSSYLFILKYLAKKMSLYQL
jgi:hypothetical protein